MFCRLNKAKQLPINFENLFSNDSNLKRRNVSNAAKPLSAISNVKAVKSGDLLAKYNNNDNRKRVVVYKNYIKPGHSDIELNSEVFVNSENQPES